MSLIASDPPASAPAPLWPAAPTGRPIGRRPSPAAPSARNGIHIIFFLVNLQTGVGVGAPLPSPRLVLVSFRHEVDGDAGDV